MSAVVSGSPMVSAEQVNAAAADACEWCDALCRGVRLRDRHDGEDYGSPEVLQQFSREGERALMRIYVAAGGQVPPQVRAFFGVPAA